MRENETKPARERREMRERERDGRKRMNRVIMAQCESCCRKRENG